MPRKKFRGYRWGDDTAKLLEATKRARPVAFPTYEVLVQKAVRCLLPHDQNLSDNVQRILRGQEPLEEIVIYRVKRRIPPSEDSEAPPPR